MLDNNKMWKVSIVTVCYNSVETIEQTIRSVLGQSYKNIEYIIIDGKSTDGTVDVIKKYQEDLAYFVSESDQGIYDAMNKGILKATGNIIGIINSDDWYARDAIEKVVGFFGNDSVDLIHGNMIVVEQDGNEYLVKGANIENDKIANWYEHPTVFVKREIYMNYGLFNLKYKILADGEFMLRVKNKVRIGYLPEVIAYFRIGGISNRIFWRNFREAQAILKNKKNDLLIGQDGVFEIEKRILDWRINHLNKYLKKRRMRLKNRSYLVQLLKQYNKKNYIIWGTGIIGKEFYGEFNRFEKSLIINFIDNNNNKHDKYFDNNIKIVGLNSIHSKESLIVIASTKYSKEISSDLIQAGLVENFDFIFYADVLKKFNEFYVNEALTVVKCAKEHKWKSL